MIGIFIVWSFVIYYWTTFGCALTNERTLLANQEPDFLRLLDLEQIKWRSEMRLGIHGIHEQLLPVL